MQGQQGRKRPVADEQPGGEAPGQVLPAPKRQHAEAGAAAAALPPPAARPLPQPSAGIPAVPLRSLHPLGAARPMLPAMVAFLHQQQEAVLKAAAAAAKTGCGAAPGAPGAQAGVVAPAATPGFRPVAMMPMPVVLQPAVQKQALAAMQAHAARLQAAAAASAGAKAAAAAGASQVVPGRGLPMMIPMQQFVAAAAAAQQQLLQQQQKQVQTQPQAAR